MTPGDQIQIIKFGGNCFLTSKPSSEARFHYMYISYLNIIYQFVFIPHILDFPISDADVITRVLVTFEHDFIYQ